MLEALSMCQQLGKARFESENVMGNSNRIILAKCVLCGFILLQAGVSEARVFGKWRSKRGGRGDGNVTSNAPVAPSGLSPTAQADCPDGLCDVQAPGVRVQVGRPVYRQAIPVPMAPVPQAVVQTQPTVVVQENRVVRRVVQQSDTANLRVERLMVALENRLGIKPAADMSGNPTALLHALPIIELVKRSQDGEVEDSVELNLEVYVRRQLGLKE